MQGLGDVSCRLGAVRQVWVELALGVVGGVRAGAGTEIGPERKRPSSALACGTGSAWSIGGIEPYASVGVSDRVLIGACPRSVMGAFWSGSGELREPDAGPSGLRDRV